MSVTQRMTRVAAVLTCHNRKAHTLACLDALHGQKGAQRGEGVVIDVYLVDDGSSDGTAGAIARRFPGVRVMRGDGDLYWAGGMRAALREAFKGNYDFYLWLNDDTRLDRDAVSVLLATHDSVIKQEGVPSVIVGATRDPSTGAVTYGGRYRPSRLRPSRFRVLQVADVAQATETMNGNVVLVPQTVVDRVGNIDMFRHSFGDQDYGLRARAAGCNVWVAPGTVADCPANANPVYGGVHGGRPLVSEFRGLFSVKGLYPRDWMRYSRRWHGPLWPLFWLSPYVHGTLRIAAAHLPTLGLDRHGGGRGGVPIVRGHRG